MKKLTVAFLTIILAISLCACGGENIEKDILGDWYNANDDTVVTFTFTEEKCELHRQSQYHLLTIRINLAQYLNTHISMASCA